MIELRTLGVLELHGADGRELRPILQQPKRLALLVYLALAGTGRFQRRDSLVALFWPELDAERARGALRRSLYFLRQSLGSGVIVGRGDEEVAIAADVFTTDVARFAEAIAADRLADAVDLYRGELLHSLYIRGAPAFEHWLDGERTRLRNQAVKAAWTLANRAVAQGEPAGAAHWARWAAALTPYDEPAHRELLTILQRTGDRAAALRAYEEFAKRLRTDYEMAPSAETTALVQQIRSTPAPASNHRPLTPEPPRGPVSPRVIAVLPFAVRGSRELAYLGEGMVDLLSTTLDDAGDLRTVDPRALLSYLGREGTDSVEPTQACRIAAHFGAGMFLLGSIVEAGGRLRITATLYDEGCAIRATAETSGGGEAGLFDMVDEISRLLLARESDAPGSRLRRLGAVTTMVLPALKAYLRGESEFRAGRYHQALEHYQNAAAEDRTFALAYYRLSAAAAAVANLPLAREAIAQARLHGRKLAEHDRMLLDAQDAWLRGAADEAERLYRAVLATHVDDLEAWFLLGDVLFHHNSLRGRPILESREAFMRTLRFDPDHLSALIHLARLAALEGERAELDRLVDRVLALSPAGDRALSARALRAFTLGNQIEKAATVAAMGRARAQAVGIAFTDIIIYARDHGAARRLAQLFARMSRGPEERALCHLVLAHLELAAGNDAGATAQLGAAAPLDIAWTLEVRALFAALPFRDVGERERRAVLKQLTDWDAISVPANRNQVLAVHNGLHPVLRVYLIGVLAARVGDFADSAKAAQRLDDMADPSFAPGFVGGLARGVRAHRLETGTSGEGARLARRNPRRDLVPAHLPLALSRVRARALPARPAPGRDGPEGGGAAMAPGTRSELTLRADLRRGRARTAAVTRRRERMRVVWSVSVPGGGRLPPYPLRAWSAELRDDPVHDLGERIALRIEYVVLRRAVDRGEEDAREDLGLLVAEGAQQRLQLPRDPVRPEGEPVAEAGDHPALEADEVREPPVVEMAFDQVESSPDELLESLLRGRAGVGRRKGRLDIACTLVENLAYQIPLVLEVVVHEPLRDARLGSDGAHGGSLEAGVGEDPERSAEDPLAAPGPDLPELRLCAR